MNNTIKRHVSLQPLSRDHGTGLLCAQHGHKAVRASEHDRVRLAEQIRLNCKNVFLSYLEDERRVLAQSITDAALSSEFQGHHNSVRKLLDELELLDPSVDPGLGLMASIAAALETYVRWEENTLFPALEKTLNQADLSALSGLTTTMEAGRKRPTQLLHRSIALSMPTGLPEPSRQNEQLSDR